MINEIVKGIAERRCKQYGCEVAFLERSEAMPDRRELIYVDGIEIDITNWSIRICNAGWMTQAELAALAHTIECVRCILKSAQHV